MYSLDIRMQQTEFYSQFSMYLYSFSFLYSWLLFAFVSSSFFFFSFLFDFIRNSTKKKKIKNKHIVWSIIQVKKHMVLEWIRWKFLRPQFSPYVLLNSVFYFIFHFSSVQVFIWIYIFHSLRLLPTLYYYVDLFWISMVWCLSHVIIHTRPLGKHYMTVIQIISLCVEFVHAKRENIPHLRSR